MNKKITKLFLTFFVAFQYVSVEAVWPFTSWKGLGGPAVEKVVDGLKDPATKAVTDNIGTNFGHAAVKGLNEVVNNPATKTITDDFGKNTGATAATAIAGAVTGTAQIAAAVAVAAGAAYAVDKVVDRFYPLPQEQANRAEATTRVIHANIQNVKSIVTLEESEDEAAFTRCIRHNPKQVRNTFGCPGYCQDLYRGLALANKKQLADEKLARLQDLDEAPVMRSSAEKAEEFALQSFEKYKNSNVPMFKIGEVRANDGWWSWSGTKHSIELPWDSVRYLDQVAPLSPKRFNRVIVHAIQSKYPNMEVSESTPKLDENGRPYTFNYKIKVKNPK